MEGIGTHFPGGSFSPHRVQLLREHVEYVLLMSATLDPWGICSRLIAWASNKRQGQQGSAVWVGVGDNKNWQPVG